MENNRLEGLPDNLGELPSVVKMDLSTNNLRFLPLGMGGLSKVQRIDVGNNLLTKVRLGGWAAPRPARTQRCVLCGLDLLFAATAAKLQVPPSMGHLKTLKEFNLRYNNLDERYKVKVEEGLSK